MFRSSMQDVSCTPHAKLAKGGHAMSLRAGGLFSSFLPVGRKPGRGISHFAPLHVPLDLGGLQPANQGLLVVVEL